MYGGWRKEIPPKSFWIELYEHWHKTKFWTNFSVALALFRIM